MSLRDMTISIAFDVNSSGLETANSLTDDLYSNMAGVDSVSSGAFDTMAGGASDAAGSMGDAASQADDLFDAVSSGANAATDSLDETKDSASGLFDTLADNWGKITLGAGGLGAGIEAAARSGQDLELQTGRISRATGLADEEVRELATSMSNATYHISDVAALLELGAQRGLDSAEALERYGNNWDLVADATGLGAAQLAEAGTALQIFSIGAGEEEQAMSAFGYITQNTTQDVAEFLSEIERVGPDLDEMGISLDETAALFGLVEGEMGLTGRQARTRLNEAIKESDGDFNSLLETLGVTQSQFNEYTSEVESASDVIQNNADEVYDLMTPMQHLQSYVDDLTYAYGPLIQAATALVPLMLAIGPAFKFAAVAKGIFSSALWMSPITWIVASIVALIAIIWVLVANWDEVSAWLMGIWEVIRETATSLFSAIGDFIVGIFTMVGEFISSTWNSAVEITSSLLSTIWDTVVSIFTSIYNTVTEWMQGVFDAIKGTWDNAIEFMGGLVGQFLSLGGDIIQGLIDGILSKAGDVVGAITSVASSAWDAVTSFWNTASPSKLMIGLGHDVGDGFTIGIDDRVDDAIKSAEGISEAAYPGNYIDESMGDGTGDYLDEGAFAPNMLPVRSGDGGSPQFISQVTVEYNGDGSREDAEELARIVDERQRVNFPRLMDRYNKRMQAKQV